MSTVIILRTSQANTVKKLSLSRKNAKINMRIISKCTTFLCDEAKLFHFPIIYYPTVALRQWSEKKCHQYRLRMISKGVHPTERFTISPHTQAQWWLPRLPPQFRCTSLMWSIPDTSGPTESNETGYAQCVREREYKLFGLNLRQPQALWHVNAEAPSWRTWASTQDMWTRSAGGQVIVYASWGTIAALPARNM